MYLILARIIFATIELKTKILLYSHPFFKDNPFLFDIFTRKVEMRLFFFFLLFASSILKAQTSKEAQFYLDHSDYKNAIVSFEALKITAQKNSNTEEIVLANNGIANSYTDVGAYYKSNSILTENLNILNSSKSKNSELYAKTHVLMASNYSALMLLEDYKRECNLFYSYYQKAFPDKQIYKALYYAYIFRYYKLKYRSDKAAFYAQNALKIYRKNKSDERLIDVYKIYQAYSFLIRDSQDDIVNSRNNQLEFADSLLYFFNKRYPYENVRKSAILISTTAVNLDLAASYLFIEKINISEGKKYAFLAIADYDKAIAINDKYTSYNNPQTASYLSLKGLMYFYLEDYEKAVLTYDDGIKRLTELSSSQDNFVLNNYTLLVLLKWKAWCLEEMRKKNQKSNNLFEINRTLIFMEQVWDRYAAELINSDNEYFSNTYNLLPYPHLMKNNLELYELTNKTTFLQKVIEYEEKSKYAALLNEMNSKQSAAPENKILNKKRENAYTSLSNTLISKSTFQSKKESNLKNHIEEYLKEEKKSNLLNLIQTISLNEIQKNLNKNQAIVTYDAIRYQDSSFVYIKLIESNKVKFIRIKDYAGYERVYRDFAQLTTNLKNNNVALYKKQAYVIYKKYFQVIEKEFSSGIEHIEIIADDTFSNVPFEALPYENIESNDYRKLPYLLKKYQFSYSMSSSINRINNLKNRKTEDRMAVFSPTFENKNLSELAFSKNKAKKWATDYDAVLYEGKAANLTKFQKALQTNNMVTIFSHGQAFEDFDDEKKGIYLSDDFLSLDEIYNLKSNCDFLILGACETGYGDKERGEGNINLSRAFTSIGVKSMLLSSWKIDEKSTMNITESFLNYLQEGATKSEALQKAKLDYLKTADARTANPYYWAGLYLLGNNENIQPNSQSNSFWWGLLLFPITGGLWYGRRKKIFKKKCPI